MACRATVVRMSVLATLGVAGEATVFVSVWGRLRYIGVLDGVMIVKGEGAVLGVNWSCSIVTNGDFATQLFPNYFGQDFFYMQMTFRYLHPPSENSNMLVNKDLYYVLVLSIIGQ